VGTTRAVGTYGFKDVFRRPSLLLHAPQASEAQGDVAAVRAGGARVVSCFLRGPGPPYPTRLTYGTLLLAGRSASWKHGWWRRADQISLDFSASAITTRRADQRERGVKKGPRRGFSVVTCSTPGGAIDLVVPPPDQLLVADFFRAGRTETQMAQALPVAGGSAPPPQPAAMPTRFIPAQPVRQTPRPLPGIAAGIGVALVGAAMWAGAVQATHNRLSIIGILIGFAMAFVFVRFGLRGALFAILAALLAVAGCALGDIAAGTLLVSSQVHVGVGTVLTKVPIGDLMNVDGLDGFFYALAAFTAFIRVVR
jgi:uncharacterized membrane protein